VRIGDFSWDFYVKSMIYLPMVQRVLNQHGLTLSFVRSEWHISMIAPETVHRISVDFDPDLLEQSVSLCQLGDLNDVGLIWSLFRYVTSEYEPGSSADSVEMRASMYTNMLQPGLV
jgi:hypothetical protein